MKNIKTLKNKKYWNKNIKIKQENSEMKNIKTLKNKKYWNKNIKIK